MPGSYDRIAGLQLSLLGIFISINEWLLYYHVDTILILIGILLVFRDTDTST